VLCKRKTPSGFLYIAKIAHPLKLCLTAEVRAMMQSIRWIAFLCFLPSVCLAKEPSWFVANVTGSSAYTQSSVWNGRATGLNGRNYDFSGFYKAENITFNLAADVFVPVSETSYIVLPLTLDSGYKSDLYTAAPRFSLGLGFAYVQPTFSVSLVARGLDTVGGSVEERPCRDSFDREFHCGTALPWSDVKPYLSKGTDISSSVSLRAILRF